MSFDATDSLARRMARPQRHRLLQGYPAVPLMGPAIPSREPGWRRRLDGSLVGPAEQQPAVVEIDRSRKLIVGIIPHLQCKPKISGCGFCTFGHHRYRRSQMQRDMSALAVELGDQLCGNGHDFAGRKVEAVYFGGGTANLTPIRDLEAAFERLAATVDLREAELTLEGVPSQFLSMFSAALRWLGRIGVARPRLSMGVQTFDVAQLRRMGREHFGDASVVARVVREARKRNITSSGDLLFNLPHQTRAQMLADVEQAVAIGFDQICIYHLVLYEGLKTPWSRDPALLAALPSTAEALDNWLALREALLAAGYVQTTLTNFERADVNASDRRFVYEELSFSPAQVDALGIGPLSISTFIDIPGGRAVKLLRNGGARPYHADDLYFGYDATDLELLYLTRSLPRMCWRTDEYRRVFAADLDEAHAEVIDAVVAVGLAERGPEQLSLTPKGMFFADSIAGLLAERRVDELRGEGAAAGVSTHELITDYHMG